MRAMACTAAFLAALMQWGCASDQAMRREALVDENLKYADRHLKKGEKEEAAQLYMAVLLVDPGNARAEAGLAEAPDHGPFIMEPSLLGKNRTRRVLRKSPALWIVLYPVNVILDVLDIVSFRVGLEGGVYASAHVTRAMNVTAGAGGGSSLGWWQKREFAVGTGHVAGLGLGPFSLEAEGDHRAGTHGITARSFDIHGLNRPSDFVYQRYRDFWSIGVRGIALVAGVEVEVHPVEIADALASIFFLDFLHDDIGHTRGLGLKAPELEAMQEMIETLTPAEYRARIRGREAPAKPAKEE